MFMFKLSFNMSNLLLYSLKYKGKIAFRTRFFKFDSTLGVNNLQFHRGATMYNVLMRDQIVNFLNQKLTYAK